MRQIKLIALFFALTTVLFSCDSDKDDDKPTVKSIELAASGTTTVEDGEKITFTVKTDLGDDVTGKCKFFQDDKPMNSNVFTPTKAGEYKIKAVYEKFTSNVITITVTKKVVPITAIKLTADKTAISPNTEITFTVMADNGKDVTKTSKITVNGEAVEGNTFTPTKDGEYKVKATYEKLTSNEVVITVKTVMDAIILDANHNRVEPGEEITFTVKGNNGVDLTDKSDIYVNDQKLDKPSYKTDVEGTYTVRATYKEYKSNEITFKVKDPIMSMTLSASLNLVSKGQEVTFKAISNMGSDIIEKTTLYVNDKAIEGHTFKSSEFGKFKVKAVYKKITSNEVEIEVADIAFYQMFPVVEDYTGTWCGWCPRVAYAIELLEKKTDKAIPIAIHAGKDPLKCKHANTLLKYFRVEGFPTAIINRGGKWSSPEPSNLDQVIKLTKTNALLGVALSSKINGDKIDVTVKVKTAKNFTNTKLVVMLLENGVKAAQSNYTKYYGGKSKIKNFIHNHVLRDAFTDVRGDDIPDAEMTKGNVYTKDLSLTLPKNVKDINKTDIVAFVVDSKKHVLNARMVKTGEAANDFVLKK